MPALILLTLKLKESLKIRGVFTHEGKKAGQTYKENSMGMFRHAGVDLTFFNTYSSVKVH